MRDPAAEYDCIDCGEPAAQWSYSHSGVGWRIDPERNYVFSTDVWQYDPRCTICHLVFDGRNLLPLHDIIEVRQQWKSGEWTLEELAEEFGVTERWVLRIVNGESWATLTMRSAPVRYWRQRGGPSRRLPAQPHRAVRPAPSGGESPRRAGPPARPGLPIGRHEESVSHRLRRVVVRSGWETRRVHAPPADGSLHLHGSRTHPGVEAVRQRTNNRWRWTCVSQR